MNLILAKLTNFVFSLIEFLLGLRIILKLLGASVESTFVQWVYETSDPLISPFEGMFPTTRLEGAFQLEISTVFALLAYAFVGYLALELLAVFSTETKSKKK